jgi:putative heme-binding domain-containing protein
MIRSSVLRLLVALLLHVVAVAENPPPVLSILTQQIAKTDDPATQLNLLRGMNAALKGRRGVAAPPEWAAVAEKLSKSNNAEVRDLVQSLGTIFGSRDAFAALRKTAADAHAPVEQRRKALESLISGKDAETAALLRTLLKEPGPLRPDALRGLAAFNEADMVDLIMSVYSKLSVEEKRDALGTLASRPAWAKNFVWLLDGQQIPHADISVTLVRQLRSFKDTSLDDALDRHFGKMSGSGADKQPEIAKIKEWLTADFVKSGNATHGREVFSRTCALCHKLFDAGMEIGPELTGANRTDIDYLLQNVVDPNALIGADYQLNTIELKDGRILVGMIRAQDANTLTVRTMTETLTVPIPEVKTKTVSPMSMMPEGLLTAMSKEDARDLFRYLGSPQQVPLVVPK